MFIHRRKGWEIPESQVTPASMVLERRSVLAALAGSALVAGGTRADAAPNPRFIAGRALTPEADSTTYNNFYEFGTDKSIYRAAQRLPTSPWQIEFAGMVDKSKHGR